MRIINCSLDALECKIGDKQIICFGAGTFAKVILGQMSETVLNRVNYMCDNDKDKWGSCIIVRNKKIMIISPDDLRRMDMGNFVLFISSRFWDEIYLQLNAYSNLKNSDCFVYIISKMNPSSQYLNEDTVIMAGEVKIPKKLHYFWFGDREKPEVTHRCIESWKRYCKGWEIIEWNEKNYNVYKNRFTKEVYDYGHYSALSSYARFDVINRWGGVYVDTDVEIVKSLEPLLYHDSYMGFEVSNYINSGHGFGGCADNPFFAENVDIYDHMSFYDSTGIFKYKEAPLITTEMLTSHGLKLDGSMQKIGNTVFYPSDYFDPALQIPSKNTYSVHRYSSLWSFKGRDMETVWEKQRQVYYDLMETGKIVTV